MPKQFFTERDIHDLYRSGVTSLEVTPDTVLTDLAYEKARQLGLTLTQAAGQPPAAPVRPYLSQVPTQPIKTAAPPQPAPPNAAPPASLVPELAPRIPQPLPSAPPQPSAPQMQAIGTTTPAPQAGQVPGADLAQRIRQAVMARLGSQVDPALVDRVIERVLINTGLK